MFFNRAMNYGSLGAVIGHEILHSFDDRGKWGTQFNRSKIFSSSDTFKLICFVGRRTNKFGNLAQWWTEHVISTYEKKAQCFIDQYNNLTVVTSDSNHTYTVGTTYKIRNFLHTSNLQLQVSFPEDIYYC